MCRNEVIDRYIHCIMQNLNFKKCTGFRILFSRSKHRSMCLADLFRGQAGWIFCGKGLKI